MFIELLKKKDYEQFARIFYGQVVKLKKEKNKVFLTLCCYDLDDNPIKPFPEFILTDFFVYLNPTYAAHQSYAINDWRTFLDEKAKLLGVYTYGEKLKEFNPQEYEKWQDYKQQNKKNLIEPEVSYVTKLKPKHFVRLAKKLGNFIEYISCEYQPDNKCWLVNFVGENDSAAFCFYDFDVTQEYNPNYKYINYVPFLSLNKVKNEYTAMMSKLFEDYQQKLKNTGTTVS